MPKIKAKLRATEIKKILGRAVSRSPQQITTLVNELDTIQKVLSNDRNSSTI